jgi:hypothetical protein
VELLARLMTTKRLGNDHGRTARAGTSAGHRLGRDDEEGMGR